MTAAASSPHALAPWLGRQFDRLVGHNGHALLLQGPSGLGQYPLALALAQAWLCHQPSSVTGVRRGCGSCPSCHGIAVRTHPDLRVLMPETLMLELEWPLDESAQKDIDDKKRKASREIRVDAARDLITFTQRTASGDHGKVVLIYPADRMNGVTANTLLKTLEEPSGDTRFILATDAQHQLLPTIRSRCVAHAMEGPSQDEGVAWLTERGMSDALSSVLLRAAGGRPEVAWSMAERGWTDARWTAIPKALKAGQVEPLQELSGAELVDVLQKVCHDQLAIQVGASPRFFPLQALVTGTSLQSLSDWAQALQRSARTADHPFQPGLMLEAQVGQARHALTSRVS
jgi:DNA polymerase-3 subunit delta'